MDRDRRRFDDRRGGESYRPGERPGRSPSRGYESRRRSPPRNRSRPRADTWVPSNRAYGRPRSRSPEYRRRSRTPPFQGRGYGPGSYGRRRSPQRRFSPRRDDRIRSPPPSWRPRSPGYNGGRPRDLSRGRGSPRRARDPTPGSQDPRATRDTSPTPLDNDRPVRTISPEGQSTLVLRSQSSADAPRREQNADKRDRPLSRSRQVSPVPVAAAPESSATSRRSSPSIHPDRAAVTSTRSHSRSPIRQSHSLRPPTGPGGRSPYRDSHRESEDFGTRRPQDDYARTSDKAPAEQAQISGARSPGNIPTQPRNAGFNQPPPSGPSQGPKMAPGPSRGPHNLSMLSAPTRPRRGPGSRDGPWAGPPMARRGPPATPAAHGVPSGPRASFSSPMSGGGGGHYRHGGPRQHSAASVNPPTGPKPPNHLAGLGSIIPGGRAFPSTLDPATEKRLLQLESDREKILEQVMETQKMKRAGLRDWDRLDRESSICALKSELAEGHLQRMAEESSIGGGVLF